MMPGAARAELVPPDQLGAVENVADVEDAGKAGPLKGGVVDASSDASAPVCEAAACADSAKRPAL